MVIASLPALLGEEGGDSLPPTAQTRTLPGAPGSRAATNPYESLALHTAHTQHRSRELADVQRMRHWIDRESDGRTEATRAETQALNRLLRSWFSTIVIDVGAATVEILATRRQASLPGTTGIGEVLMIGPGRQPHYGVYPASAKS